MRCRLVGRPSFIFTAVTFLHNICTRLLFLLITELIQDGHIRAGPYAAGTALSDAVAAAAFTFTQSTPAQPSARADQLMFQTPIVL